MNLEELLKELNSRLETLSAKDELTDEEKEQKEKLEREKKALEDQQKTEPEDEVARLRRELAERNKQETAKTIAAEIVAKTVESQKREQEELSELVRSEVSKMMGGDVSTAVETIVKSSRSGSRWVGASADESIVDQIASGGSVKQVSNGQIRVENSGAKKEAKDIFESKNLGSFFGIIAKATRGEMWLSEGEREFVKTYALGRKAPPMAEMTDAAGGYLVPQEWMDDILGLLRAQAIVRRANPRIVPFNKQMNQTSLSTGSTASYTNENARITPSDLTFAEAPLLTPKNLTALVPVSNYLLADAPAADEIIRSDMTEVIALREDLSFLRGTGASGEPIGLRNKVGRTDDPLTVPANGFQPTMADLRRIRAVFRNTNAGAVRLAWFFHPAFLAYLETRTDSDGRFLLDTNLLRLNDDGVSGVVDGVPFYTSTQIPANITQGTATNATDIMLVNMADTIVGLNQELELAVSNEAAWTMDGTNWNSAFQQNQTLFRAVVRHDIAHRRPAQIVVQSGVLV